MDLIRREWASRREIRRRRSGADSGEEGDSAEDRRSRTLIVSKRTSIWRVHYKTVRKTPGDNKTLRGYWLFAICTHRNIVLAPLHPEERIIVKLPLMAKI